MKTEIRKRLSDAWSFNDNQVHTHTWHDKQDFLEWLDSLPEVSDEKDRRIRELEEALESVLPFANEVLTKQGKDPDTREIFGYNNQALNIGQMRKIVQALNPPKP